MSEADLAQVVGVICGRCRRAEGDAATRWHGGRGYGDKQSCCPQGGDSFVVFAGRCGATWPCCILALAGVWYVPV